ncbi:MAG TPA: Clp protease N-terminal domain-containing protein [Streptosporangiaceae bacterium]|nr:Clp protease N-terminal domain-containing protein [Streptosporangiaceae bacterium]
MAPPPTLQELIEIVRQDSSSDQPLDQLVAAAAAAAQLEETTDALLGHFVDRCRRDGRSWTEISAALGVTKQAVHKRFASALAAHIVAATPSPTFERFTDRARHVAADARQAAIDCGAGSVGPEHLLLALFSEPAGVAARALAAMDVSKETVAAAIRVRGETAAGDATAGDGTADDSAGGSGPAFSGSAKQVLRDALTVALEFGHNYIGTEHLLLGLYRNADSAATRILLEAGAPEATARAHVSDMLRGFGQGK